MRFRRQQRAMPLTCAQVMQRIAGSDLADMDPGSRGALARHLRRCARCRRCTDYLRHVVGRCRELPTVPLSPSATEKLVTELVTGLVERQHLPP